MKKADLHVGSHYALVEGEGASDKNPRRALKVEVLELGVKRQWGRGNDGILVKIIDDPLNQRDEAVRVSHHDRRDDGTFVVSSRRFWLPWAEAVPQIEAHVAEKAQYAAEAAERTRRITAIADELKGRGYGDARVSWPYLVDSRVSISVDVLEKVLGLKADD